MVVAGLQYQETILLIHSVSLSLSLSLYSVLFLMSSQTPAVEGIVIRLITMSSLPVSLSRCHTHKPWCQPLRGPGLRAFKFTLITVVGW